jgi:hypothetical protein
MRTKARKEADPEPAKTEAPVETKEEPSIDRLTLPLNSDGTINFSSLRERTREKLKKAFTDPAVSDRLGVASQAAPVPEVINPLMVSGMYDLVGTVEAMVFSKTAGIPPEIARKVFIYSEKEKEALAGPTIRVMNKYLGPWFVKYQDEWMLISMLVALTIAKATLAQTMMKMQGKVVEMPKQEEPQSGSPAPTAPAEQVH